MSISINALAFRGLMNTVAGSDGKVKESEIKNYLKSNLSKLDSDEISALGTIFYNFDAIDLDKSGKLDDSEFTALLARSGVEGSFDKLTDADFEKNGVGGVLDIADEDDVKDDDDFKPNPTDKLFETLMKLLPLLLGGGAGGGIGALLGSLGGGSSSNSNDPYSSLLSGLFQ